jgi:hypothetical protein
LERALVAGFEAGLGIDQEGQEGTHREGTVPEETRLEVQDTSQEVRRRALEGTHQGLEVHHDPSQLVEEGRKVGIEDAERREEHLEVTGLAGGLAADQADSGVAVGEELELELEAVGDLSIYNESVICRLLFPRNRTIDSL